MLFPEKNGMKKLFLGQNGHLTKNIQIQQSALKTLKKKKRGCSLICQAEHRTADKELPLY